MPRKKEFKAGEIVQLISGGPNLTVVADLGSVIEVVFFDTMKTDIRRGLVPAVALKHIEKVKRVHQFTDYEMRTKKG